MPRIGYWDPEIQTGLPTITEKSKPVIYLADGRQVTVKKPVGFAGHPAVPPLNKPKG